MGKSYLKNILSYINKVYHFGEIIKGLNETRKRPQIPISTIFSILFMGCLLRVDSIKQLDDWIKSKRLNKLFPKKTRMPSDDTLRRGLQKFNISSLRKINEDIIQKARKNGVFRKNNINGLKVVGFDGVDLFESTKKSCPQCLTRVTRDGVTHFYHKAVACMNLGPDPHLVLGMEMLYPKEDGSDKDEGELTGAKRLFNHLYKTYHHFADVIVGDALYANEPFISLVLSKKIDVVIRMKDKRKNIMKEAIKRFENKEPSKVWEVVKGRTKTKIESWEGSGFSLKNLDRSLRVYYFKETTTKLDDLGNAVGKEKVREIWVVTSIDKENNAELIWEIIHKRWDIENCGFRQLKMQCKIGHCYVHDPNAIVAMLTMMSIAFNLFQLYLFCRLHNFRKLGVAMKSIVDIIRSEAMNWKYKFNCIFYSIILKQPKSRSG
jgi:hypothetical protein